MTMRPDPTFHATAKLAMQAPRETLAFALMLSPDLAQPRCRRRQSHIKELRQDRPSGDNALQGRRVSPLRMATQLEGWPINEAGAPAVSRDGPAITAQNAKAAQNQL